MKLTQIKIRIVNNIMKILLYPKQAVYSWIKNQIPLTAKDC